MKKTNTVYLFTVLPGILTGAVFLFTIFLLDTAKAQLNVDNTFKTPFISATPVGMDYQNTQQSIQSVMHNSEKDIVFIENLGQVRDTKGKKRPDVLFLTRSQGVDMYITSSGITYVFRKTEGDIKDKDKTKDAMPKSEGRQVKTSLYRLDMEFVGMNKNFKIKKELAVEQQFNYYTPEYPNGISPGGYKKITIENIYDGIDLMYYEKEGRMKYDFIVKAGADPNNIKMKYKGAGNVYIDKDGSVIITTPMGEIREEKPYTYSRNTGEDIKSSYEVINNLVQFDIANYKKNEDIIIDPYRIWATRYGGNDLDKGYYLCTDNSGNLYVTGETESTNFPTQTLSGAYNQTNYAGGYGDAFILKFNNNGTRLWATYYGGSDPDGGNAICTDNSGNIYVTGFTMSTNFPIQTLSGAYNQTTFGGGFYAEDAFILKFSNSGARLWATYYGGSGKDEGYSICIDNSNNLYVIGKTYSNNFPVHILPGAYNQTTRAGGYDVFILKFTSNGSRLWATYYGGGNHDGGYAICTDNSGALYITGCTSGNFPLQTLAGAYNQTTPGGSWDAFILKFASSGARIWATYYGGNGWDEGYSICIDNSGNLYVTGRAGINFPTQTLSGAYNQTTYNGGNSDVFILKFASSGARIWATYYGGNNWDIGWGIYTDNSNATYLTGETRSNNFPTKTLTGAYNQVALCGDIDAFILKFSNNGERIWATHYGGSGWDYGYKICVDNSDNIYITGYTLGADFPTLFLSGAYNQTTLGGYEDAFILKFSATVDIKKISNEIPSKYSLQQNYPNPFNPITNIKFDIPKSSFVKMIIYNSLGKEVVTLVNEKLSAGSYGVDWNGSGYTSGVYFYKLITDEYINVRKMLLVK